MDFASYVRPCFGERLGGDAVVLIATNVVRHFGKQHDDASCIALKHLHHGTTP